MKRRCTIVTIPLSLLAAVSCIRDHQPPLPAAAVDTPTAAVAVAAPAAPEPIPTGAPVDSRMAALLDSGELIVGNRVALEAWRPDGTSHRTLSPGPALHPRRFGHDHVIALRNTTGPDLRDGAVLELITLADGTRRELAQLPAFRCAGQDAAPKPQRLDIEDPPDFEVNSIQHVACLGMMDGSGNAASVRVRAKVELSSARVQRWLALGETDCAAPPDVKVGDPSADGVCWRIADVAHAEPNPSAYPFIFANEFVRTSAAARGSGKVQVRGYEVAESSPSERWLLLAGDFTERESTYRRLLLLDRDHGKLFPIVLRAGGWPAPLVASGAKLKTPIKQAELVSSTTDVRWLGSAEDSEALVLDKLVIKPGRPSFEVTEGELAR